MIRELCPPPVRPGGEGECYGDGKYPTKSTGNQAGFPLCELRDRRIIDDLPKACPLAEPEPGWAAFAWEQRGDLRLAVGDSRAGVADRRRGLICEACTRRSLHHPIVQSIRVKLGVESNEAVA